MAESSDIYHDGRILKEAKTLSTAGYNLAIYGFKNFAYKPPINNEKFKIISFPVISRKYRILRNFSIALNILIINILILFTKAEVYHAHNTMFLFSMYLSSKLYRGKFVYDCHEVQWEHNKVEGFLESLFIHRAHQIINVCEGRARCQSQRYNIDFSKILILNNYPKQSSFIPKLIHENTKKFKFVFSGGYNLIDNRLDNFITVLKSFPDVEFHIIGFGYGNSENRLMQFVKSLNIQEQVCFHPLVHPTILTEKLSEYDMAVNFLSNPKNLISYKYPAINKMYEFLSAGLPILTSDLPAFITDYVDYGVAITVSPEDHKSIANGISYILDHKDLLFEMRKKAFSLSQQLYNWEKQEYKLLNLYEKLVIQSDLV